MLTPEVLAAYFVWYLPPVLETTSPRSLPPMLAPANAEDLSRQPSAYIGIAEYDPLRDDGCVTPNYWLLQEFPSSCTKPTP